MNCYFHPVKLKETQGKSGTIYICGKCKSVYRFIIVTDNSIKKENKNAVNNPNPPAHKTRKRRNKRPRKPNLE